MSAPELIPAEAWKGVGDPKKEDWMPCPSCGSAETRILSMGAMVKLDERQIVDANTFMIPGRSWGYVQCDDCERRQVESSK